MKLGRFVGFKTLQIFFNVQLVDAHGIQKVKNVELVSVCFFTFVDSVEKAVARS